MIKILIKEPDEDFEVRQVEDNLDIYQKIVGGWIEVKNMGYNILLVCNEEGLIFDLPINYFNNYPFRGTIFFVRKNGEKFSSLTDSDIELIKNHA